jgi:hypothetical protein
MSAPLFAAARGINKHTLPLVASGREARCGAFGRRDNSVDVAVHERERAEPVVVVVGGAGHDVVVPS